MFLTRGLLRTVAVRRYQPDYIVMPIKDGHWVDPDDVTRRMINIIRAHDAVKDPEAVTKTADLRSDVNLDDLDLVEIFLEVEKDFFLEFEDDTVEKFKTIADAVEYISNYRFADTY
jgi:acyl carrier protein